MLTDPQAKDGEQLTECEAASPMTVAMVTPMVSSG